MEKKVYELKVNETFEHVMPPLQEMELKLLPRTAAGLEWDGR